MPQADLLSFHPTLLLLPVVFLGGYILFVTRWAPRIVLTFKARAWLTRYTRAVVPLAAVTVSSSEVWPELVLMFVQFAGLIWVVTRVAFVTRPDEQKLFPLVWIPPAGVSYAGVGAFPVENFFTLWTIHRETLFFAPAAVGLTHRVDRVLAGFGFFNPGKQFPLLGLRLKKKLADAVRPSVSEATQVSRNV